MTTNIICLSIGLFFCLIVHIAVKKSERNFKRTVQKMHENDIKMIKEWYKTEKAHENHN